jgi:hypothetical protein
VTGVSDQSGLAPKTLTISDGGASTSVTVPNVSAFAWALTAA